MTAVKDRRTGFVILKLSIEFGTTRAPPPRGASLTAMPRRAAAARQTPRERPASGRAALDARLKGLGLKRSRRRDLVIDAFLATRGHVSIDELTTAVRRHDPRVGHTTVYRAMKLLAECGEASARRFGDGHTRYERAVPGGHHDHLVCDRCGAVEEFEDAGIEQEQAAIARRHGFELQGHTFELHGHCRRCTQDRRSSP